jgi:RHS repeat-associated protein
LGGGDDNLTQMTQYVDATTTRVTTFLYDWRDRRTATDGEVDFYEQLCFDNLGRVIHTDRRDTTATGNLVERVVTAYDDRGRVYQAVRYGVDPTTGIVGNALTDNTWYDAAGKVLKSQSAGSQSFTKSVYDGVGRVTTQYTGYNLTDSSYANASSVATDTILEQVETSYDAASNVIQVSIRQRYHNATGVGPLGSPSSAQPLARVTYTANWQDGLGRVAATADYGTNGGTALVRPATIPARSETCLVTSTAYDNAGQVQTTTDPAGMTTCFSYDAAGREIQRILNCQTLSSSSSASSGSSASSSSSGVTGPCPASDDTNVTVLTAYNPDGNVSSVTAVNAATGNQVTQYTYGTTLASSGIASSLLKVAEVYPDSVGGSDQVSFTYNRQDEVTTVTDQNGTVHSYNYDLLGRRTQDRVTTLGAGVDGAVLRIATAYEVRGMVSGVTSYDNPTVGAGNVVNDVQLTYNAFGQLTADYQSHTGTVVIGSTPVCQYAYADGSANTIRPTTMTYPNGRLLNYSYGSVGGMADALSRVASLIDNDGATHLADYSYLGQDSIVEVSEPQPTLLYTLVGTVGGNDPDTGDIYRGLDRFGRVKDLLWYNQTSAADVERVQHRYDRAGNRLWRLNPVDPGETHDELYSYDGLYRLKDLQRGTLNSTQTVITPETFAQCWGLDATGNWQSFRQDEGGNGNWDLVQGRVANPVNEITLINNTFGSLWVTPVYDPAGNMTTMPQPSAPGSSYTAVYDAWNRLVKLSAGGVQVAGYQYDGQKRRMAKLVYTSGVLSESRYFYYSRAWQVLEERVGTSSKAERQMVWGQRYIDDLLFRNRDTTGGGTLNEQLYGVQDPNWNLTALIDVSGAVVERYGYNAYGVSAVLTPDFVIRLATLYDWETRYGGYRWDKESVLYQVRNRYYDSGLGCFLSRDPIATESMDSNIYAYTNSNPTNRLDASGQEVHAEEILYCAINLPFDLLFGVVTIGMRLCGKQVNEATSCCLEALALRSNIRDEFPKRYGAVQDDTVFNAIYHCAWMCMLSNSTRCSAEGALRIGRNHEDFSGNPPNQKRMDLHNNGVGVAIGQLEPPGTMSWNDCFAGCDYKATHGKLWWFRPPRLTLPWSKYARRLIIDMIPPDQINKNPLDGWKGNN